MAREYSLTTALLSVGIEQVEKSKSLLAGIMQAFQGVDVSEMIAALARVADPDLALLSLARIVREETKCPTGVMELLVKRQVGMRTLRLLGASEFFGSYIAAHREILLRLESGHQPNDFKGILLDSVSAVNLGSSEDPCWVAGETADILELRRAYYTLLAEIAAADLSYQGLELAKGAFVEISSQITCLVDACLEAVLALARRDYDPQGQVDFTVIAMGKTGGEELNYISDVDVIYVAQPACCSSLSDIQVREIATNMAISMGNYCSGTMEEPSLWTLDASLRPEGKDGVLVRGLDSHVEYYERWAKPWEFQALLKARPAAGTRRLGEQYLEKLAPFVWKAVESSGFVEETRAMRRRVEKLLDPRKAEREIKLGIGGLRDVEFTVQLLQLVHGRTDSSLRVRSTLDALRVLVDGGYIGRDQGEEMADYYRFLRVLEHRTQLYRMRRTHLYPQGADLRRVARSIDPELFAQGEDLTKVWQEIRIQVRRLHEEIYYRPLLPAMELLSAGEAALDETAAMARLQAIGYRDPKRALEHIEALSSGVTRRAAIQRQLLPVLLGWLASGVDPDGGLLAFRQVSEALGDTHWYLRLLRDSGLAASRLTKLLSSAPLVAQLLPANPDAVQWLDSDDDLRAKTRSELESELLATFVRQPDEQRCAQRLRAVRAREILRCAMADVINGIDPLRAANALSFLGEAVLSAALDLALARVCVTGESRFGDLSDYGQGASEGVLRTRGVFADYLIVAMGRLGGRESGYATDADVVFFYEPVSCDEATASLAAEESRLVVSAITAILGSSGLGSWSIDTGLRPEGKSGLPARDINTLDEYLRRWSAAWERQALLRANPIVGNPRLCKKYLDIVNPYRYECPLGQPGITEIRRLKARMETERVSVSTSARRQVKLGAGGLSDVEWCVQLLQMRYAFEIPQLRTTSTREALQAACQAGLLSSVQVRALDDAWMLATRIRAANVLGSGRITGKRLDELATGQLLVTTAALLGYSEGEHQNLVEDWLRTSRLARATFEKIFYEWDD